MNEVIELIRNISDLPIAILTNSSLFYDKEIQRILNNLDIIVAKLDAPNRELFQRISQPVGGITFKQTFKGIKELRRNFNGKFALQTMFMNENKNYANELAELAKIIDPDEVQINTPLRPCEVIPLSKKELDEIEKKFKGLKTLSVYNSPKPMTEPLDMSELYKRSRFQP
jgi:wyosine [tRNA(Phe)-imidazoG37] synthetase (radical SAM superfamily)